LWHAITPENSKKEALTQSQKFLESYYFYSFLVLEPDGLTTPLKRQLCKTRRQIDSLIDTSQRWHPLKKMNNPWIDP
jgi:hypothetical protein